MMRSSQLFALLVAMWLLSSAQGQLPMAATCVSDDHVRAQPISLSPIATGFEAPTSVTNAGDGSGRLFVTEKAGRVLVVEDGQLLPEPYLDITDLVDSAPGTEKGLLSIAFHPEFAENRRFFVFYSDASAQRSVLAEYRNSADNHNRAAAEGRIILTVPQYQDNRLHKGGQVMFGPDGHLYFSAGDGQAPDLAQDLTTLTGAISRIDVDSGELYAVPDDNPFVGIDGARPELWAYGFRNPWRFSFDPCKARLFVGDVGPNTYEEINLVTPGGNYGWPVMVGVSCTRGDPCGPERFIAPLHTYGHIAIDPQGGNAVIGGIVYRGNQFPSLAGRYLFADFTTGAILTATERVETDVAGEFKHWVIEEVARIDDKPSSFGQTEDGIPLLLAFPETLYEIAPRKLTFDDVVDDGVSFLDQTLFREDVFKSKNWTIVTTNDAGERFRWGKGPQSEVTFDLGRERLLSLRLRLLSPIREQAVTISHNGRSLGAFGGDEMHGRGLDVELILLGTEGTNTLTFEYRDWNGNETQFRDNPDWTGAVRFGEWSIGPAAIFGGGTLLTLERPQGVTLRRFTRSRSFTAGFTTRWGLGPSSAVEFNLDRAQEMLLNIEIRSPVEDQRVTVEINGDTVATFEGDFSVWRKETLSAQLVQGNNRIVFHYQGWNGNPTVFRPESDSRKHAVEFRELAISFVGDEVRGEATQPSAELGRSAFGNCAGCHQATGLGIPTIYPPLAGHAADLYNAPGGRDYLISVLLYGLDGEVRIAGELFNGEMPAWNHLGDEEIAAVINYILSNWGNDANLDDYRPITPPEVAALRQRPLSSVEVYRLRRQLELSTDPP